MWDLKLSFIMNFFLYLNIWSIDAVDTFLDIINPFYGNGLLLLSVVKYYFFAQNLTIFFVIKFILSIAFLILIRGGTPRYRYDYLTKLGWLKFIGLILFVFMCSWLLFLIF